MNAFASPLTLTGQHVRLEPLSATHHDALVEAVRDGSADLGLVTTAPVPDLRFEPYGHDRLCVVVPQRHTLKARAVRFEQLLAPRI